MAVFYVQVYTWACSRKEKILVVVFIENLLKLVFSPAINIYLRMNVFELTLKNTVKRYQFKASVKRNIPRT